MKGEGILTQTGGNHTLVHKIKIRLISYTMITALFTSLLSPLIGTIPAALADTTSSSSQPTELQAYDTEYSNVYRNPDGTITSKIYFAPVNYQTEDGNFHPINTDLVSDSNGGYKVNQNRFTTQFGAASDSSNLETVNYNGNQVSFQLAPLSMTNALGSQVFSNPQHTSPSTDHSTITYSGVYPDVSLKEEVTSLGVKETIVLNKYVPGLHSFAFVLNTKGVTPQIAKDGSVDFVDTVGNTVFNIPPGIMQDSNVDPHSGDPQQSNAVTYQLQTVGGKTVLMVSVDEKWLAAPSRVYPVSIDPTINIQSQITDAYVSSAYPTTNYSGSSLWNSTLGYYDLHTGYYDSTTGTNWAYFHLPPGNNLPLLGLTVNSAYFNAYADWSYYSSTAEPTWLFANTSANWNPSTITWNTIPSYNGTSISSASTYQGQWAQFNITSLAQDWSNQIAGKSFTYFPPEGFFLSEAGNGQTYWHKFASIENSSSSGVQPYIQINYAAPNAPWGAMYTHDDPNGSGYANLWWNVVPGASSYDVLIWNGHNYQSFNVGNVTHWTTKGQGIWPTASEIQQGKYLLHTDKSGAELALDPSSVYQNAYVANGSTGTNYGTDKNYWFRIEAVTSDGQTTDSSNAFMPTMQSYVPDKGQAPTMVPLFVGAADAATGNFVLQDTDLTTSGYGPQVSIDRTYNQSAYNTFSPFGNGWRVGYQTQIDMVNNLPHLVSTDGSDHIFWPQPDGSYASPPGLTSDTLTAVTSNGSVVGYDLKTNNYTTEEFQTPFTTSSGQQEYLLTDVKDKNGNKLSISYSSYGNPTTMTDASGRTTTFNYNSSGLVTSVTFAANSTTNETWNYGYDTSNNLVSVTDPSGNVTQYGYTNGELTGVTTPNGNMVTISYGSNGYVSGETNPAQKSESISYGTGTTTLTDPLGVPTVWTYDNDHLNTQTVFDPSGLNRKWTTTYNEFGEVLTATDPLGYTTTNTYDGFGQLQTVTDPNNHVTTIHRVSTGYGNINHEISSVQLPAGGTYQFQYDQNHNQITSLTPQDQISGSAYNTNGTIASGTYPISTANNPLDNNSFESWTSGLPTDWSQLGASHTNTQSSDAIFGGSSWQVSNATGVVDLFPSVSLISTSNLNDGVAFEAYAKASSASAAATTKLQINFFDSNGNYVGQADGAPLSVSGKWTQLSVVVPKTSFPSNAVSFRPILITDPTSSDTVNFDAVDVVGYNLAPQYNAIVNGDFSNTSNPFYDWSTIGTITAVNNSQTDNTGSTETAASFGSYQKVAQIVPSSSWSGVHPSDSNEYIPYVPSQSYTIGAMLKGYDSTATDVSFEFYNSSKQLINQASSPAQSGTFGWQYETLTLKSVPTGTAYIMPEVLVAPTTSSTPSDATSWATEMRVSILPDTTQYTYDSSNSNNYLASVTDPLGNVTQYQNNPFGDVQSVTDPNGNTLSMTYTADHQLATQTSSSDNLQVQYTYDKDGNVTKVSETNSAGSSTYATQSSSYNNLDQLQSSTDALGNTTSYLYDANGRLNQVTLPDTHTLGVQYNNAGEPTTVTVDNTSVNQYGYNADGWLTSAQNGNNSSTYGYDKVGNLTSQTDSVGSQAFTYNADNALKSMSATVGTTTVTTNYNLGSQDQVKSITNGSGANLATYSYNEQGLTDTLQLGNGMEETFRYDGDLHLQSMAIENGSTVLDAYQYSYDKDGNLTEVDNLVSGTVQKYQYDAMNRLTSETLPNGNTVTYTYDALGNILSKTVKTSNGSTVSSTTYGYNAGNQLTSVNGQAYTYDANGNLTSTGTDTYKWNELGQLTEVDNSSGTAIATYTYDSQGRRVSETAGGQTTKFYYIGGSNLVAYETDGSGNLLQSYTYGPTGSPLTLTTWSGGTGTTYYYHENGHGDVVALTDSSGNTVAQYTYDAWGNILSSSGTLANTNPYLYAGYRWDSAIGMYYLNARYYAPNLMRFISKDPVSGLNAYTYADDNPIMKVDPSGEWSIWDTVALVGAGIAAVALAATGVGIIADAAILEGALAGEGVAATEAIAADSEAVGAGAADATAMDTLEASTAENVSSTAETTGEASAEGTVNSLDEHQNYNVLAKHTTPDGLAKDLGAKGWTRTDEPGGSKSGPTINFTHPEIGTKIRIQPSPNDGNPYFRVQNTNGNYLDANGLFPSNATRQELRILTHFYFGRG